MDPMGYELFIFIHNIMAFNSRQTHMARCDLSLASTGHQLTHKMAPWAARQFTTTLVFITCRESQTETPA
jgi:hypothetical protein